MKLLNIKIKGYRNFNEVDLDLDRSESSFYSLASANGGGKSTLQQFVFTTIHCLGDSNRYHYIANLLDSVLVTKKPLLLNILSKMKII